MLQPRHPSLPRTATLALPFTLLAATLVLAGCDIPGIGPDPRIAQREAEAKAIGGACRHALRGLEDCFTLNPKAPKALVFAGWKDMDSYMREHKLEGAPSVLTQLQPPAKAKPARSDDDSRSERGSGSSS